MSTISIRPAVSSDESGDAHQQKLIENAQSVFHESYGRMIATLKELLDDIERPHLEAGKPIHGLDAVNGFLGQFSDYLEGNSSRIVGGFGVSGQFGSQPSQSVDAQRLAELESQSEHAQRVLATAERATELEMQLSDARTENARLQRELTASQAEVHQLKREADKPNPLSERNRQLEAEVNDLTARLSTADDEKVALEQELVGVKQERDALQAAIDGMGAAPSSSTPEPAAGSQPADGSSSEPEPMIGNIHGEPSQQPAKKKGLRGYLGL